MQFLKVGLAVLSVLAGVCQADLLEYASQLPACGASCIIAAIPTSVCQTLTNSTCICTDPSLAATVQLCLLEKCSAIDTLTVARIEDEACGRPQRSRKRDLYGLIGFEAFTFLCILFRLFSRWRIRSFELDDYLFTAVAVFFVAFTAAGAYARIYAFGVDMWWDDPVTITTGLKLFLVEEILYNFTLGLSKLVILSFMLRIFPNDRFRLVVLWLMGAIVVYMLIFFSILVAQCQPLSYLWDGWKDATASHYCLDVNTISHVQAALSIAQDVIILFLPVPLLMKLNIPWRKRLDILLMFSLNIFVVITSCIRIRYLVSVANTTNPTWDYTDVFIWTGLEVDVSIIVVCIPTIRSFITHATSKYIGSSNDQTEGEATGNGTNRSKRNKFSSQSKLNTFRSTRSAQRIDSFDGDSQLELGDKSHGRTKTEIAASYTPTDGRSRNSNEGIRVLHTTTMTSAGEAL